VAAHQLVEDLVEVVADQVVDGGQFLGVVGVAEDVQQGELGGQAQVGVGEDQFGQAGLDQLEVQVQGGARHHYPLGHESTWDLSAVPPPPQGRCVGSAGLAGGLGRVDGQQLRGWLRPVGCHRSAHGRLSLVMNGRRVS
jgi:hypothetical protein